MTEFLQLPAEIRLPPIRRLAPNRGLASRGVDTRDVIRLDAVTWERLLRDHDGARSPLSSEARRYLPAIETRGRDLEIALAVPGVCNAFNAGDPLARAIIERSQRPMQDQIGGKRIADLVAAWSRPAGSARRWVVEDGRVPVELSLLNLQQVPAQRLFFIDGDDAVPALMMSRLFAVWARALLPTSTSWTPRFQVSRTFEALPVPASFTVMPAENGSPPQLRISGKKRQGELADLLSQHAGRLADAGGPETMDDHMYRFPPLERIDHILLEELSLAPDCTDLDILERLVDQNQNQGR